MHVISCQGVSCGMEAAAVVVHIYTFCWFARDQLQMVDDGRTSKAVWGTGWKTAMYRLCLENNGACLYRLWKEQEGKKCMMENIMMAERQRERDWLIRKLIIADLL